MCTNTSFTSRQPGWQTWVAEWLLWIVPAAYDGFYDTESVGNEHHSFVAMLLAFAFALVVAMPVIGFFKLQVYWLYNVGFGVGFYLILGLAWMRRPYR